MKEYKTLIDETDSEDPNSQIVSEDEIILYRLYDGDGNMYDDSLKNLLEHVVPDVFCDIGSQIIITKVKMTKKEFSEMEEYR